MYVHVTARWKPLLQPTGMMSSPPSIRVKRAFIDSAKPSLQTTTSIVLACMPEKGPTFAAGSWFNKLPIATHQ